MSQYPPPGSYPPVPPPPGYPPAGFPPPQGYPGGMMPPQRKGNGFAVASLVSGLVFCIPGVSQLLAIIFGLVGLGVSGKAGGKGRVMSVFGILLGLLGIGLYSVVGIGGYRFFHAIDPQRPMITQFVNDVYGGNIKAAKAVSADTVTEDDLTKLSSQITAFGTMNGVVVMMGMPMKDGVPGHMMAVTMLAYPNSKSRGLMIELIQQPDGKYVISKWQLN